LWIAAVVLVAFACLGAPAVATAAAPKPRVVGDHLVDARNGLVFVPRGVNWPSFEYACRDGYGYSNKAGPRTVGPDAAGAALIASWHINTVRVPLNQDCWLGDDGLPAFGRVSGYRRAVRRWVSTLHKAGLVVVLDLHWSGPEGVVADGQRVMADDRSDDFWRSVARTFRKDRSMIFDVFNEPYSRYGNNGLVFDLTWNCWRDGGCDAPTAHVLQALDGRTFATIGMQALVDAIRATGAKQPIVLSGRDFGNDVSAWMDSRPAGDQLVAGFHNYNHQPCHTEACWDATAAPLATRVPVVIGEFAESLCTGSYVRRVMDWADRHGIGYLLWAWWILPQKACSNFALVRNVKGVARKPNGTALKAHLARLVPRLTLGGDRRQALDTTVEVRVRCSQRCRARARGRLLVARKRFRLEPASGELVAGRAGTLALKLPDEARWAAATSLLEGDSVSARITIVVTNGSHTSTKQRVVRLRPA
jgi:endoglucanase